MEVTVQKQHVRSSEALAQYNFSIKASAKSIELMIAQLYKDRLAAFIRELGTNAYEAHQMLGIEDEPFEVTLPTLLNPAFKIRDFGPGLSPEEIGNVYVQIFESTKTHSNEMGGCFGLGSKSPFAYSPTIQFGVVSYNGGQMYCYSVYRDEVGFPKMDLLHQEPSNARTGIEISIPIARSDHQSVEYKARQIYKWFKTTPKLLGGGAPFAKCNPVTTGTNFGHYNTSDVSRAMVRMGNICYQIDSGLCNLYGLERYPLVVEFKIGDLTPEPSREGLSYDKKTKRAIEEAFATIKGEMIAKIQPKVDVCKDYFDAVLTGQKLIINSPVSLDELKFNNVKLDVHLGTLDQTKTGVARKLQDNKLKKGEQDYLQIKDGLHFFWLDKKCAYHNFIKHHLTTNNIVGWGTRVFICDTAYQNHKLDDFCKFFKIDKSRVVTVSEIPYVAPKRGPNPNKGNKHITKMFTWEYSHTLANSWKDVELDVKKDKGMFVVYHRNKILIQDGTSEREVEPYKLRALMDLIGYNGVVYGVRKDTLKKVLGTGNWTNFLDYAKPLAYNAVQSKNAEDAAEGAKLLQAFRYKNGSPHDFIEALVRTKQTVAHPDITAAVAEFTTLQGLANIDYRGMAEAMTYFYGVSLTSIGTKRTLDRDRYGRLLDVLNRKFPLLTACKQYTPQIVQELSSYIVAKGI